MLIMQLIFFFLRKYIGKFPNTFQEQFGKKISFLNLFYVIFTQTS